MIKINFWNVLTFVTGLGVTVIVFFLQVKEREPTFFVNPSRPIVIDSKLIDKSPLTIIDSYGDTIKTDVRLITFYFFNQGNESIRRENILEPLFIKVSSGRIIDKSIITTSRAITNIVFDKIDSSKTSVEIDFNILEKNDGFAGQITVAGNVEPDVYFQGTIEGVKTIKDSYTDYTKIFLLIAFGVLLMLSFIVLFFALIYIDKGSKRSVQNRLTTKYKIVIFGDSFPNEKTTIGFSYAQLLAVTTSSFLIVFIFSGIVFWNMFDLRAPKRNHFEVPKEIIK